MSKLKNESKKKLVIKSVPKNIISLKNVNFSFNNHVLYDNLNINIKKGDFVAILGPNGTGKTTFVKLIAGLIKPTKGKIIVKEKLFYIPQKLDFEESFPITVFELLNLESSNINEISQVLNDLEIDSIKNKKFSSLSGGQKQRVLIAMSLLSKSSVLIFDETTAGMDVKSQINFFKLLKKLNEEKNITIVFVTHDIGTIPKYFKSVICIFDKNVCFDSAKNVFEITHKIFGKEYNQLIHNHIN
jgi:zinc transport system ATP-binding protein